MAPLKSTAPFKDLPSFPKLTKDYLANEPAIRSFYQHPSDLAGVKKALQSIAFKSDHRKILAETFRKQYKKNQVHESVSLNIELLSKENTFTVCTGHQCCLFTGPLYFIGKIINALVLSNKLNSEFTDKKFIPVLCLHTEDHDLPEIDHIELFAKNIRWDHAQTGSAGELQLTGIESVLGEVEKLLSTEAFGPTTLELLRKHYSSDTNLYTATHGFVNELFGKYGLLILDPREKELKQLFKETIRKEILEHPSEMILQESNEQLGKLGYDIAVNPREINLFYLSKGKRERIIREDHGFRVADGEKKWSVDEMSSEIEQHPENFSPNVVLRPIYQQTILPNVAYVGGPSELAYWLQFNCLLKYWKVPAPVLIQRNIVFWFNTARFEKWKALGLLPEDILQPEEKLVSKILSDTPGGNAPTETAELISTEMKKLAEKLGALDQSLKGAVLAEETRLLKGLGHLQQKLNKALKAKEETKLTRMRSVQNRLSPGGQPEERTENFMHWYAVLGPQFFDTLIENFEAFPESVIILTEQKEQ